jgi:hypothetical protein
VTLTLDQGPSATSHAPSNDDRYALDVPSGRDRLRLAVAAIRLELLNRGRGPNPLVGLLRFGSASGKQQQKKQGSHVSPLVVDQPTASLFLA